MTVYALKNESRILDMKMNQKRALEVIYVILIIIAFSMIIGSPLIYNSMTDGVMVTYLQQYVAIYTTQHFSKGNITILFGKLDLAALTTCLWIIKLVYTSVNLLALLLNTNSTEQSSGNFQGKANLGTVGKLIVLIFHAFFNPGTVLSLSTIPLFIICGVGVIQSLLPAVMLVYVGWQLIHVTVTFINDPHQDQHLWDSTRQPIASTIKRFLLLFSLALGMGLCLFPWSVALSQLSTTLSIHEQDEKGHLIYFYPILGTFVYVSCLLPPILRGFKTIDKSLEKFFLSVALTLFLVIFFITTSITTFKSKYFNPYNELFQELSRL